MHVIRDADPQVHGHSFEIRRATNDERPTPVYFITDADEQGHGHSFENRSR